MEVPAGQDGIQQLLAAEQEAQMIVSRARQEKAERLRQAKDEAAKEVLMYKQEKEEEFAKSVESDAVSGKSTAETLARDAEEQIAGATRNVSVNKGSVLELLLSQVKTV